MVEKKIQFLIIANWRKPTTKITFIPVGENLEQSRCLGVCRRAEVLEWRRVRVAARGEWELYVYSSMGRGLSLPNSCEWSMAANSASQIIQRCVADSLSPVQMQSYYN